MPFEVSPYSKFHPPVSVQEIGLFHVVHFVHKFTVIYSLGSQSPHYLGEIAYYPSVKFVEVEYRAESVSIVPPIIFK